MTTPEFQPFLQVIIDRPDDDLPRLLYADWLQEHGKPGRAEFIHVQCELARMPQGRAGGLIQWSSDEAAAYVNRLHLREQELLTRANRRNWCPHAVWAMYEKEQNSGVIYNHTFRRGFVECLSCSWEDWCSHADDILATTPLLEVTFTAEPELEVVGEQNMRSLSAEWPRIRKWTLPESAHVG